MQVYLFWRKKRRRVLDYNQPDSIEAFHKFYYISLINKNQAFVFGLRMNDVNPRQKHRQEKWHRTTKFAICYWKMSKKKFQFTHVSAPYESDSFIRGYHVYQHIWTPVEGETYSCTHESGNEQDCNAVAVIYQDRVVVGHIPLAISKWISVFYPSRIILRN